MSKPTLAVDWWRLASNVPCSRSDVDSSARYAMFRNMDGNGNGLLASTEVERFLKKLLGDVQLDAIITTVRHAFDGAKAAHRSSSNEQNELLDLLEFRQFLGAVKRHFFERFLQATATEGDGVMDVKQFTRFVKQLQHWGVDADALASAQAIVDARKIVDTKDAIHKDRLEHAILQWAEVEGWASGQTKDFEEAALTEEEQPPSSIGDGLEVDADGTVLARSHNDSSKGLTASGIDLPGLISKLPCAKYSSEQGEARKRLWDRFDASGNGALSLNEISSGLMALLKTDGDKYMAVLSSAISRAFHAAKGAVGGRASNSGVTRGEEFRLLLVYLKRYFELLIAFDRIDTSHDRRMDAEEFRSALRLLAAWGVAVADPNAAFASIDADGSGKVVFDEFCTWALLQGLDMDPTDNVVGEASLKHRHASAETRAAVVAQETDERHKENERRAAATKAAGAGDQTMHLDLRAVVGKLPVRLEAEDAARRSALFASCDTNQNGELAMTELLQGLCLHFGVLGKDSARAFAPAIRRAFHETKDPQTHRVRKPEFHALLVCMKLYFELLVVFDQVDTSDDRKVDWAEFERALPLFAAWGVRITDPGTEFRAMNANGGGFVLFGEFAAWSLRRGLDVWKGRELQGRTRGSVDLVRKQTVSKLVLRAGGQRKKTSPRASPRDAAVLSTEELLGITPSTSLAELIGRMPCGAEHTHQAARAEIFDACDTRGDGMLQPSDVDAGLRALISAVSGRPVGDPEPAGLPHAFHATLLGKPHQSVDLGCFRNLLCHLKWYTTAAASSPRGQVPVPLTTLNPHKFSPRTTLQPRRTAARLPPLALNSPRRLSAVSDPLRWPYDGLKAHLE